MPIRRQATLLFAFAVVLSVVAGIVIVQALHQAHRTLRLFELTHQICLSSSELSLVAAEGMLIRDTAARAEFDAAHRAFRGQLDLFVRAVDPRLGERISRLPAQEVTLPEHMGETYPELEQVYVILGQAREVYEHAVPDWISVAGDADPQLRLIPVASQFVIWNAVRNLTDGLSARLSRKVAAAQNRLLLAGFGVSASMVVLLGIIVVTLGRRLAYPLTRMAAQVQAFGAGHQTVRLHDYGENELGDLARAFNRMADNLSEVTASRDDLDAEMRQRVAAEAAREEALAELKRSNDELELFAYAASHDLLEPLRAVSGYTGLLRRRYADTLDERGIKYIKGAEDGALRMQEMIDALLAFSRVTTRGGAFAPADVNQAVSMAWENLASAASDTGARIEVAPLPRLVCDAGQLTRLFQNLFSNAIKFRRADAPPHIRVSAARAGGFWRIDVSDNGIGIDERDFERIFVIFRRLHREDEYPGTGLGLALCRRIAERHGGHVAVRSAIGRGSTFSVFLGADLEPLPSRPKADKRTVR